MKYLTNRDFKKNLQLLKLLENYNECTRAYKQEDTEMNPYKRKGQIKHISDGNSTGIKIQFWNFILALQNASACEENLWQN